MREVVVVIGPGHIGQAITRRVGIGKHVVLADLRQDNAGVAAEVIASQSRHRLPPLTVDQNKALATTPAEASVVRR